MLDSCITLVLHKRNLAPSCECIEVFFARKSTFSGPLDSRTGSGKAKLALTPFHSFPESSKSKLMDTRIITGRRVAERFDIRLGGTAQARRRISRRRERICFALRMCVPETRPLVFPGSRQEPKRFAILALL